MNEIQTQLKQYNPGWRFDVQVEATSTPTIYIHAFHFITLEWVRKPACLLPGRPAAR
ncbi:MAG: hypothetical protein PF694_03985 [Bacteroidetes bacterium]|nr:hypothetical protein [Bacteroidota bacterium]